MLPLAGRGWELHSGGSSGFAWWAQREPEPLMPMPSPCSPSSSCAHSCSPGGSHGVPAPRRGLPAAPGSGGSASVVTLVPKPKSLQYRQKKQRRETRILLPPGSGGDIATHALSQMSRVSTRTSQSDIPEPCSSPLHLLASPTLLDAKGKGEQPSSSSPPPGLAHPGFTESTAGRGPPWSHGLETQCSWRLPGA